MTTNQTIDDVPREKIERALDAIEQVGYQDKFIDYTFVRTVKQELRALLDAEPCSHDPGWRDMSTAPTDGTMVRLLVEFEEHSTEDDDQAVTIGANNLDNDDEDLWRFAGWCWSHDHFTEGKGTPVGWLPMLDGPVITPTAQPQGEPVAWGFVNEDGEPDATARWDVAKHLPVDVTPLYAEQPAPLKIGRGVSVKNIWFGSDEERKPYLVFSDNGNLTEVNLVDVSMISRLRPYTLKQLEELGVSVEKPELVAVALPDPATTQDFGDESMANGWNACLDEVLRLNTK